MMNPIKLHTQKTTFILLLLITIKLTAFAQPDNQQADTGRFYYGLPFAGNLGIRFKGDGKTKYTVYEGIPVRESLSVHRNIIIDGTCAVELADIAINDRNAGGYRYRITLNDGVQPVSWAKPSVFIAGNDKKYKYAYLGHFNYKPGGQSLKVEIFRFYKSGVGKTDVMQVSWGQIYRADVTGSIEFTTTQPHIPTTGLASVALDALKDTPGKGGNTNSWNNGRLVLSSNNFIETTKVNDIKFRLGDSLQNISLHLLGGNSRYFYNVSLKSEIDGRTDSVNLGETEANFDIYKDSWNRPGKYTITFTPKIAQIGGPIQLFHNLATHLSFTVLPAYKSSHSIPLKVVLLMLFGILSTVAYIFVVYRTRQKRKLAKEAQKKHIATMQLQSIRSQLNPHFVFNALAGIQNLMNKNEIENANKYLARFARLTRNILDDGQRELTTIESEIVMLTDYLQMEQMRFGFNFNIDIPDNIDQQIEIPAMLLQPFAENAVKHGISALKENGVIVIGFALKGADLVLSVRDNGKGFTGDNPAGMGIKLCEERIALLNSIYKNTTIILHKRTEKDGAVITIELKNWV